MESYRDVIYVEFLENGDIIIGDYTGKSRRIVLRFLEHRGERARWLFLGPEFAPHHYQTTAGRKSRTVTVAYLNAPQSRPLTEGLRQ